MFQRTQALERGPLNASTIYVQPNGKTWYGSDPTPQYYKYLYKEYRKRGPVDSGDILFGMASMGNRGFDGGPGYGYPPDGGAFESRGMISYRLWQTTRTNVSLLWHAFFFLCLAWIGSFFVAIVLGAPGLFIGMSKLTFFGLVASIALTPLLLVGTPTTVIKNANRRNQQAVRQMAEPQTVTTEYASIVVANLLCGECQQAALQYVPVMHAYCPVCAHTWMVAGSPNLF